MPPRQPSLVSNLWLTTNYSYGVLTLPPRAIAIVRSILLPSTSRAGTISMCFRFFFPHSRLIRSEATSSPISAGAGAASRRPNLAATALTRGGVGARPPHASKSQRNYRRRRSGGCVFRERFPSTASDCRPLEGIKDHASSLKMTTLNMQLFMLPARIRAGQTYSFYLLCVFQGYINLLDVTSSSRTYSSIVSAVRS